MVWTTRNSRARCATWIPTTPAPDPPRLVLGESQRPANVDRTSPPFWNEKAAKLPRSHTRQSGVTCSIYIHRGILDSETQLPLLLLLLANAVTRTRLTPTLELLYPLHYCSELIMSSVSIAHMFCVITCLLLVTSRGGRSTGNPRLWSPVRTKRLELQRTAADTRSSRSSW